MILVTRLDDVVPFEDATVEFAEAVDWLPDSGLSMVDEVPLGEGREDCVPRVEVIVTKLGDAEVGAAAGVMAEPSTELDKVVVG